MPSLDLIQAAGHNDTEAEEKLMERCREWERDHPHARITNLMSVSADGGDCVVASILVSYMEFVTQTDCHI